MLVRPLLRLLSARVLRNETGGRRSRAQLVERVEHALGAVIGQCKRPEGLEEGEAGEREVHNKGETRQRLRRDGGTGKSAGHMASQRRSTACASLGAAASPTEQNGFTKQRLWKLRTCTDTHRVPNTPLVGLGGTT